MSAYAGRVVVIVGAGSGVGRACAHAFAEAGARLHLVDSDLARVDIVGEECRQLQVDVVSHSFDVGNDGLIAELADAIFDEEGRVDVLLAATGEPTVAPLEALAMADWRRTLDKNLWPAVATVMGFAPRMAAQRPVAAGPLIGRRGAVVLVGSAVGLAALPYAAPFVSAQHALVGLGEALAMELGGKGLHVLTACPGPTQGSDVVAARGSLPGAWGARLAALYRRWALRPEVTARRILAALRQNRTLLAPHLGAAELFGLRRLLGRRYAELARRWVAYLDHRDTTGARR